MFKKRWFTDLLADMKISKTVLITGSSKGLGEALSQIFATHSYDIILHGRDTLKLEEIKKRILDKGVECDVVVGDLLHDDTLAQLAELSGSRNLDILINNAATYLRKPFAETSADEIRRILNVNLVAPILLTSKIFPIFERKKNGLIININSFAGKNSGEDESIYCASKHGLKGFSGSLQFDANRNGVRVVDAYLGAMNTQMVKGRKDVEKCIDTSEAAMLIYNLCEDCKSVRITEVDLLRRWY